MRCKGVLSLLALILLIACHPRISTDPGDGSTPAERLLAGLYTNNQNLKTFKGIGEIRLWQASGFQTARAAWMATLDGRIRIEILGPAGRPLIKLAYDGKTLYWFQASSGDGLRQKRIRNPNLARLIDVPLSTHELIFFLAGKFPLYENRQVALDADQLELTHGPGGLRETIRLAQDHEEVESVSFYAGEKLRYKTELSDYRQEDGFSIPFRLVFSTGAAAGLEIRVERFWPNTAVSSRQFVIGPE